MPGHFVPNPLRARLRQQLPRRSYAHKIACLTLYRALLEQYPRIPLPDDLPAPGLINPIKYLIRKRFKRDVAISSTRHAVGALKVGYAAEKLLRTAGDGNTPALSKIHTLLRLQHAQSEHSRHICQPPPPRKPPPRVWPCPGAPKLVNTRPLILTQLTGARRVPTLTQTNGYAFLRRGKPQSPYLARVLRDKIGQRDKRFTRIYSLDRDIEDGNEEAEWEGIVMDQLQREGGGNRDWRRGKGRDWGKEDGSWVIESVIARRTIFMDLAADTRKARKVGDRLTKSWLEEKRLWRQERESRRYEKHLERKQKRWLKRKAEVAS